MQYSLNNMASTLGEMYIILYTNIILELMSAMEYFIVLCRK